MLPLVYEERYTAFRQGLRRLSELVSERAIAPIDKADVGFQTPVGELQIFFQEQLLSLTGDALAPEVEQRLQALQVEINKQLRLLGMDALFLQSARQPATVEQRRSQMGDRVQILIRYCDAVLGFQEQGKEGQNVLPTNAPQIHLE